MAKATQIWSLHKEAQEANGRSSRLIGPAPVSWGEHLTIWVQDPWCSSGWQSTYFVGWGSLYLHSSFIRRQSEHFGRCSSHFCFLCRQVSHAFPHLSVPELSRVVAHAFAHGYSQSHSQSRSQITFGDRPAIASARREGSEVDEGSVDRAQGNRSLLELQWLPSVPSWGLGWKGLRLMLSPWFMLIFNGPDFISTVFSLGSWNWNPLSHQGDLFQWRFPRYGVDG